MRTYTGVGGFGFSAWRTGRMCWQPAAKVSMIIMRAQQQRQGRSGMRESSAALPAALPP